MSISPERRGGDYFSVHFSLFLPAGPVGHLRAGEGVPPSTRSLCIKEGGGTRRAPATGTSCWLSYGISGIN